MGLATPHPLYFGLRSQITRGTFKTNCDALAKRTHLKRFLANAIVDASYVRVLLLLVRRMFGGKRAPSPRLSLNRIVHAHQPE